MRKIIATAVVLASLSPGLGVAQSVGATEDLRMAIEASVMSDPRVQEIPPTQLKELVDSLVSQALEQNMTAADILWQPQRAAAASAVGDSAECASGWEGYLCQFNRVFGFGGSNYEMPVILLVVSGLLLVVIWELIAHHRKKMAAASVTPPQPTK